MIIECDNCSKSFTSAQVLMAHLKAGDCNSLPTCDLCDCSYKNNRALVEHLKESHPYCNICAIPFISLQAFEQHYRNSSAHSDTYCHMCGCFFADENTKKQHMCDSDTFCIICNRDFKEPRDLLNHLSSPAHKQKDVSCIVCPSRFKTPSGVALHLETGCKKLPVHRHHITAAVNSLNIAPKISLRHSVEGPSASLAAPRQLTMYQASESSFNGFAYQCSICPRTFCALHALESHLNSPAHDEDEFKCPKCNTHFKLVSGLVQHLESGTCGLSNLKDVERRLADVEAQISRSLEL